MSKGKEGIKDLKLIGAAMGNMEAASEVGPLKDKVSQHQSHQQEQTQSAQLLEHLAQLAKEQVIKVKNIFN